MKNRAAKFNALPLMLSALWCLLLLVLFQRGIRNEENHATELARLQARTLCAQMMDTRAWNASHGGVYVRESDYGSANPWIPEGMRRATLAGGENLILVNPAYMSRQIADRSSTKGARLRITSINPLRPENRADEWEEAALRNIAMGEHEVFKLDESAAGPQNFRYMAPLRAESDCLVCHADNRLNEVRGGISVTLEATPFLQIIEEYNETLGYTYALMGLAGILGIGSLSFAINRKRLLAEHKEQMNSAFLANMSHDMRTPLTGIMGMAELLQKEKDEEKKRQACRYLRSAAATLLDMVTDITTHAALDTGRLQCMRQPFALRENLENCLELFQPVCAEKGLSLELVIADGLPPVLLGDAFRMRQALGNLVGNAVKFTERGGIRVDATGKNTDNDEYLLCLKVWDSGSGIAPEEQTHIFERFAQGRQGQTHCVPGTGLGLAITRELASLMGGTLNLESSSGEGSCFVIELRCALPADTQETPTAKIPQTAARTGALRPLRIVLAEDNKVSAYFLEEVLRQAGHDVAVACNGFDALAILRSIPVDLAILDIRMPGMNGLELTELIRKGGAGVDPELPILSITASRNKEEQTRLRELNVRVQAEKPLSAGQLLQLVEKACVNKDMRTAQTEQVFNQDAALEKVDGQHALLRKLAAVLLDELPQKEQELAQAMARNNPAQVHYLAHALKNSAAMLQLQEIRTASAALEKTALAREDCRESWQALEQALPAAKQALISYIDSWKDSL
ncbi:MAG: ATP-binding protein [Desulfovibrionaceae bacterium]|nr:ATP-binding protein [Desulfovibrionaceae bacterium]